MWAADRKNFSCLFSKSWDLLKIHNLENDEKRRFFPPTWLTLAAHCGLAGLPIAAAPCGQNNQKWKYERANYAIRSEIYKLLHNNLGRWNLQCARNGVDNRVAHQNATWGTAEGAVGLNESIFHAKTWYRILLFEKPETNTCKSMKSPVAWFHQEVPPHTRGSSHSLRHQWSEEHPALAAPPCTSRSQLAAWPGVASGGNSV